MQHRARVLEQDYEMVGIESVRPHPKNPRQGDVGAISESIEANGFYGAIVVQRSTGFVLAGNHRLMAARAQGLSEVPCVWVDVDDERAVKILLADNRTNDLASYNDSVLAELLADLANTSDLTGTGYDGDDLDALIASMAKTVIPPDSFPEVDENIKTEHQCPKCGYAWSGGRGGSVDPE